METNAEQFKKLNREITRLESNNQGLTTVIIAISVLLLLAIGYIIYAEVEEPLFGKWPEIARQKTTLEAENVRTKSLTDSLTKANSYLMELSPFYSGVFFEVQIGAFENFNIDEYEQNLVNLKIDTLGNFNKYTLGKFRDWENAVAFLKDIQKMGVEDAFVVAKINGERVDVKEARAAQKDNFY